MKSFMQARPVVESGFRDAVALENDIFRVVVDLEGGMVPELSRKCGRFFLNAHWIPWFRGMTPVSVTKNGEFRALFQKGPLLERIAGNFPCVPSFGGGAPVKGVEIPAHGWTANDRWDLVQVETDEKNGYVSARFRMVSPSDRMKLALEKTDLVFVRESVHYTILKIKNSGTEAVSINAAWHNTIGFPFLTKNCKISASADRWSVPPLGGEFDTTGRLAIGKEFANLREAPTRTGATADLSGVPGMIGYTDFVTGAVPKGAPLGWSACVNSDLSLAYVIWFPGPEAVPEDEIGLCFNNFWMQYGGRPYEPWAMYEGASDQTFCLGMENSLGAWANGLADSIARKELLGRPTTLLLRPGEAKTLLYATGLFDLGGQAPDAPVSQIESSSDSLRLKFDNGVVEVQADGTLERLRRVAKSK
jgi:hypothetical protein